LFKTSISSDIFYLEYHTVFYEYGWLGCMLVMLFATVSFIRGWCPWSRQVLDLFYCIKYSICSVRSIDI